MKTTPFEEGDRNSKILYLAEAPSFVEMKLGRPLVGPSGEVFNDCLHASGLTRRDGYILNIWPYQVWKSKFGNREMFYPYHSPRGPNDLLWSTGRGFTEYGLKEARLCLDKISKSSANLILAMGQQATDLATGKSTKIMRWRGSILEGHPRVGTKKVIPTPHPASTIHGTYLWRYLIINDMKRAKAEKEYKDLRLPNRNLLIDPTYSDIMEYFDVCEKAGRVATDLEVINHQLSCYCLVHDPMEAMVIPLGDETGKSLWSLEDEISIMVRYAQLMGNEEVEKVNQNIIGFDSVFLLLQNSIFTRGFLGDPMIAQHIMYPEFNKGLDFIASIHTREPYYKEEGKMWKTMEGGLDQFLRYNGKDGCVALEAWNVLEAEMTAGGFWDSYHIHEREKLWLWYISLRGFRADKVKLAATKARVEKELAEKVEGLKAIAEWDFNPNSPKQCQKYFYGTKGLAPYKGKTGGITTDDTAMSRILRRYGLKEAKFVQEIRALRKLLSTYLEVAFDPDGRLRCSYNPRGTWTGRASSSETIFGRGLNMMNLDPKFKDFLIADEEPLA